IRTKLGWTCDSSFAKCPVCSVTKRSDEITDDGTFAGRNNDLCLHPGPNLLLDHGRHVIVIDHNARQEIRLLRLLVRDPVPRDAFNFASNEREDLAVECTKSYLGRMPDCMLSISEGATLALITMPSSSGISSSSGSPGLITPP